MKVSRYPRNADATPMDLFVGVLTDASGNGGARLTTPPVGPDNAPIDAKAIVLVDSAGNPVDVGGTLGASPSEPVTTNTIIPTDTPSTTYFVDATAGDVQMTLPTALNNTSMYIIRRVDEAAENDVTIIPTGANSVDGDTDALLSPGESMSFVSNQTNTWWLT